MSEHGPKHERRTVLFGAAAITGLSVAAITLARRHLSDGDSVYLKGIDPEAAQAIDPRFRQAGDIGENSPHIVYVGPGDPVVLTDGAKEVYGLDLTEDDHHRFGDRVLHVFRDFRTHHRS